MSILPLGYKEFWRVVQQVSPKGQLWVSTSRFLAYEGGWPVLSLADDLPTDRECIHYSRIGKGCKWNTLVNLEKNLSWQGQNPNLSLDSWAFQLIDYLSLTAQEHSLTIHGRALLLNWNESYHKTHGKVFQRSFKYEVSLYWGIWPHDLSADSPDVKHAP